MEMKSLQLKILRVNRIPVIKPWKLGKMIVVGKEHLKVLSVICTWSDLKFKQLLPEEMAECTNDHFQTFLSQKKVHDLILMENPVSTNIDQPQTVDDFLGPLTSKNETALEF